MNLLETSVQKVPLCRWVGLFNCAVLTGVCFIEGGMFFIETPPFSRGYVYLGGYVLEKLQRSGGGTFIWVGTSIWHRIVSMILNYYLQEAMENFVFPDEIKTKMMKIDKT